MLLGASYIFYGWWDVRFLFLVVLSTVVDFWVGLLLANGELTVRNVWSRVLTFFSFIVSRCQLQ